MSNTGVPVKLQPRTAPCLGETAWHSESALLVCSLEYGADPLRGPGTTAARIDAALGISSTPPRVLLGDVELTWRDESRLHSIELRTGRGQWEPSSLRIPSESIEHSSMTFDLAYDVNRISSVDVDVRVLWDATTACIALRFDDAEPQGGRWVTIADKGVDRWAPDAGIPIELLRSKGAARNGIACRVGGQGGRAQPCGPDA